MKKGEGEKVIKKMSTDERERGEERRGGEGYEDEGKRTIRGEERVRRIDLQKAD